MVKTSLSEAIVLLLLVGGAHAQGRISELSLDEAVQLALRHNATLQAKALELRSVRANEITAALRPNPIFSAVADQYGIQPDYPQYTVTVSQTIETGGKRQRRVDAARAATRVTEYELGDIQRQVIFQVKKSYTDLLAARSVQSLALDNLKTLDEVERVQRFRAEHGDISGLELNRIEIQRYAFERDAADAANATRAAKITLRATVGPDVVPDDFDVVGELIFRDTSFRRQDLYLSAMANRPDLRAATAGRDKARAEANLARANAWWDITPQIEYQRAGGTPNHTFGFGVSFPIRIFDRNQGEIARTHSEIQRADAQSRATTIQVLAEIDAALSTIATEREKVRRLEATYLPKARKARDTVEYAYRRGGLSVLDFLDAQRTYRETALEFIRSLGNYQNALHVLEAAVGGRLEPVP